MQDCGDDGVDELRADPGGGRRDEALCDVERAEHGRIERLHVPDELEHAWQAAKRASDLLEAQPVLVVGREGAPGASAVGAVGAARPVGASTRAVRASTATPSTGR